MKLLRMMLVVVGLVWLIGQTTAWAGAMLPRYRFEDLGLASTYNSAVNSFPNVVWLSDGMVYGGNLTLDSTDKLHRKGEYLRADVWSSQGRLEEFVLNKDGSDVNLLSGFDPNTSDFQTFSSAGKAIFSEVGSQFVFDTSTGQKINIPRIVGNDTYGLLGINGLGEMVGSGWIEGDRKALYYSSIGSEALLLSKLVVDPPGKWLLRAATDINDAGEIIGWGYDYSKLLDDGPRVFKLVPVAPVPEPSTWLILGVGSLWIFRKFRPAVN